MEAVSTTNQSFEDSTAVFVLSSSSISDKILCPISKSAGHDLSRQRRAHKKSHRGCFHCKKRRVKCDEAIPCTNCVRRRQQCYRVVESVGTTETETSISVSSTKATMSAALPSSDEPSLHRKLYHHFQTSTIQTLPYTPEVWEYALQLSLHSEFLCQAILCIAARHLSILLPEDSSFASAAAHHLNHTLFLFRQQLSSDFKSTHIDAFIATSSLLQYELWSSAEEYSLSSSSSSAEKASSATPSNLTGDRVFDFCSSLKKVFLRCLPLICDQPSVYLPQIRNDSREVLFESAQMSSKTLAKYQALMSYERPINKDSLDLTADNVPDTSIVSGKNWKDLIRRDSEAADQLQECYKPIVNHLCLILSFCPEGDASGPISRDSPVSPVLIRHILSFPIMCHGEFNAMVQQGDPHALMLVFHYYRAIRILIPGNQCWWVHKRAMASELALRDWLIGQTNTAGKKHS